MKKNCIVTLLAVTDDSQLVSAAGALGCFEESASAGILKGLLDLPKKKIRKECQAILKNGFEENRKSIDSQVYFIFKIENLPRAAVLHFCLPKYTVYSPQPLHRNKLKHRFDLPVMFKNLPAESEADVCSVVEESFQLYDKMVKSRIPIEDAGYILPICTQVDVQTAITAKDLYCLLLMSDKSSVPSVVNEVVLKMITMAKEKAPELFENLNVNKVPGWFKLFARNNENINRIISGSPDGRHVIFLGWSVLSKKITSEEIGRAIKGEGGDGPPRLRTIHFEFLAPMSLSCFHRSIRPRIWDQSIETIYDAVSQDLRNPFSRMFIPESIRKSAFAGRYSNLYRKMLKLYMDLAAEKNVSMPDAVGVIPHSLVIYNWIHVNGWNIISSVSERTCAKTQSEMRQIAWIMARYIQKIAPVFAKFMAPWCISYGKCPEKNHCEYLEKKEKRKKKVKNIVK